MSTVKRVVEMGRALRERLGAKTRQPLRAIHVRTSDPRALALLGSPFARELVLGELNVKTIGSLAADDGQLCTLKAKANFKVLGKRLGGQMKAAAAAIEALSGERVARLRAGGEVELALAGETVVIGAEDVLVQVETRADFELETDGRYVVWLDTELDEELVLEGLAREVVNRVNGQRKESGLAPADRIALFVAGEDAQVQAAIERFAAYIAGETLATRLVHTRTEVTARAHESFDLGDGRRLLVALARS
jgi:isoleucyl-tRNA synthetase